MTDATFNIEEQNWLWVDANHPLRWRWDNAEKPTILILISKTPGKRFIGTKKVTTAYRLGKSTLSYYIFKLNGDQYDDIFKMLCHFLIENTRYTSDEEAPRFVENLFDKWKRFSEKKQKFSERTIQGLIGELLALKETLIPKYGEIIAVGGWTIENYGKRDFQIENTWYEVKTRLIGNNEIKISSLEQLDREDEGHLLVVKLDHTATSSESKISLNSAYQDVLGMLKDNNTMLMFIEMMCEIGYQPDDDYDEPVYEYVETDMYKVNEEFPRLRAKDLPSENIIKAEYSLSLVGLDKFLEFPGE